MRYPRCHPAQLGHPSGIAACSPLGPTGRLAPVVMLALVLLTGPPIPSRADDPLPDGTKAARQAMAAFRYPEPLQMQLYAAEPQLASPVAICLDEQGRVYVAEEHRFNRGTEENRSRAFLLEDDLQIDTVQQRLAMYRKWAHKFPGGMKWFTAHADQVRLLADTDQDGRADRSTIFAGGFNHPLDGLAAGVIARDGDIYLTCIPNLWRLRDNDGDGVAEVREVVHQGFGVNAAFLGHDLHGLTWGPDGKLYFSVGDRGFNVTSYEGHSLAAPRRGAVFRCWPDGRDLEVVCVGLRNPQELAFDQHGNLFAADNNCDKGDHSRLVYVLEGGDSGWNMAYQTIPKPYLTGPWHAEKMWHLPHDRQPAWIVPPVGKLGAGPSGFAYYPGLGLPERYDQHFFLCNYTGNGGIESFALEPRGAGFRIVDAHDFLKPIRATDATFGYDGKLYVSDFVNLDWSGKSLGGRIYTLFDPERVQSAAVREIHELFEQGIDKLPTGRLLALLAHADMRIRLRAQYELARRGRQPSVARLLVQVAGESSQRLARLHAIWGLGQIAHHNRTLLAELIPLLQDADDQVRAAAIRVLGEHRAEGAAGELIAHLAHENPRLRLLAAMAVGKLGNTAAIEPLYQMIAANESDDPYLRHAGVMGLYWIGDAEAVHAHARHPNPRVRMATLLVQRRLKDERIAQFLDDAEPQIVTEAARAINDVPLSGVMPQLAALAARINNASADLPDALLRRVINANFRLGKAEHAAAAARLAATESLNQAMRLEALGALSDWTTPSPRDRVTGIWRPLDERTQEVVQDAVQQALPQLLSTADGELQTALAELIEKLRLEVDQTTVLAWVKDARRTAPARGAALRLLHSQKSPHVKEAIQTALHDANPRLRADAREVLAQVDPPKGLAAIGEVLHSEEAAMLEKQRALAVLGSLDSEGARRLQQEWSAALLAGGVHRSLQLDVLEMLQSAQAQALRQAAARFEATLTEGDPLGKFQLAMEGGDAKRGREIFVGHHKAQCIRCHKVYSQGGDAGPELSKVAKQARRDYLLQSLLDPNAKIAKGYGSVVLALTDGRLVAGTIKAETDKQITLRTKTGQQVTVPAADIEDRTAPKSAMPPVKDVLTLGELRDLVEYLSRLK